MENRPRFPVKHPTSLPLLQFGPEVQDLCRRLDEFFRGYPRKHQGHDTSDLLRGVFYAMRSEARSNPVWMSQAASSARDILYPLFSEEISQANLMKVCRKYATGPHAGSKINNYRFVDTFETLDEIYKRLSDLTHLGTDLRAFTSEEFAAFRASDFEKLMEEYIRVLGSALRFQQIYVHTIVDSIVQQKKKRSKGTEEDLKLILSVNLDARQYFYSKADKWWLGWLGKKGFLNVMSESAVESGADDIRIPELQYLVRMAEQRPANVVDILLKQPAYLDPSNQAIYYYFLRICQSLPAHQLARMVNKIRKENWPALMDSIATQTGFEYDRMSETLANAKDYESLLELTRAVLSVRTKENTEMASRYRDSPFFFDYLSHTGIFERLAAVEAAFAEDALALATEVMTEVVIFGHQDSEHESPFESAWDAMIQTSRLTQVGAPVFDVSESFTLSDVDFFDLELGQTKPHAFQADVRELVTVVKTLIDRIIGDRCTESAEAKRIYEEHIDPLPDSRTMWRLRLYALSLCPRVFRDELKRALFRLFEVERYFEITSGAEYEKALYKGFPVLSEDERQEFVQLTIQKFGQLSEDRKVDGSQILSMIIPFFEEKPELKKLAEEAGLGLDPGHRPKPVLRTDGELREKKHRGAYTQEEFEKRSVEEIARKLRNEWAPEVLHAGNTMEDTYNPRNATGIGEQMRIDMLRRLPVYIKNADKFFDRDRLDQHYTYLYLVGIQETIRSHREMAQRANWECLVDLYISIKESGEIAPYVREKREPHWFESWLANWDAVHLVAIDVLRDLLTVQEGKPLLDFDRFRDRLLAIVSYFLAHPEPTLEDEQFDIPESARDLRTMHNSADGKWATDPLNKASTTVRGRALEVFNLFVVQDGENVSDDVKELYERTLERENTRALMSMFGRFMPFYYFRDKDWTRKLLPRIFPRDAAKKWLYSAAWEGYLYNEPYSEIISDPVIQDLYHHGLDLTYDHFPRGQKHSVVPEEAISEHLALAFMHFKEFKSDHQLLRAFWDEGNSKQHAHFVQSLGRFFISTDNSREFFTNNPESKSRLRILWDWLISKVEEPSTLMELGLWINLDKGIFEPAWLALRVKQTLERTNGIIEWSHYLNRVSPQLARARPEDTLEIARLYLLGGGARDRNQKILWHWDSDKGWIETFEILHGNQSTRTETIELIGELLSVGGKAFWPLKDILAENS